MQRGWFARRPDRVRSRWLLLGGWLTLPGVIAVVAAAVWTHYALVPVPVVLVGLILAIGRRWIPTRTAQGRAALSQVIAFRRHIDTVEANRMRSAEAENTFGRYLPYAILFGASRKWVRAFAGLDRRPNSGMPWYVSSYPFHVAAFGDSMDSLTHRTSGVIVSTPHRWSPVGSGSGFSGSSGGYSGGYSGGGGGGGGGGSW